jgi:hypothetical protein
MAISNTVNQDGFEWIPRAGGLWVDFKTGAEYNGITEGSMRNYVFRHRLKTIQFGRKKLVNKADLDRASGVIAS